MEIGDTTITALTALTDLYIAKLNMNNISNVENNTNEFSPTEFKLLQNYPNPFNPSTKISWQSPVGSWQTLKIYDVLAKEVATLVNEELPAGEYEVEFNSNGLTSGIYFYQLKTGNFIETKKMILIK